MAKVITALSTSLDGFIAGRDDNVQQPLGRHGSRLFDWYADGDTPSRFYEQFHLSPASAEIFDTIAARCGASSPVAERTISRRVGPAPGHCPECRSSC